MKTKALISFAVTAKLICAFVFAYAKIRFSHDKAHVLNSIAAVSRIHEILNKESDKTFVQASQYELG